MIRIVWAIGFSNPDPNYWFRKQDSFQEAVEDLAAEDYAVYVVTLHKTRSDSAVLNGVHYLFCRNNRHLAKRVAEIDPHLINYWGYERPVNRLLDTMCPDVPKTVYPVGEALSYRDMPFVDRFFVTTEHDRARVCADPRAAAYPGRQIIVCPFTAPSTLVAKDYDAQEDRYCVLCVGGWRRIKRQHLLLEALPAIEFSRVCFLGSRDDANYFAKSEPAARRLYNKGYVELIDAVPHAAVPAYITESKIVVQLSESEGGSRVVPEVLATGVPLIVCSDCRVNASQVQNGVTGFVVDPTPYAVARQINVLLRDGELRRKIGTQAAEAQRQQRITAPMSAIFKREFRRILHEPDP